MARRSRSRRRLERGRGGRKPAPTVGNLLAWLIPFAAIGMFADWMVTVQILEHYREYGHVCLPGIGLAFALSVTITAICLPFIWLQLRRRAGSPR